MARSVDSDEAQEDGATSAGGPGASLRMLREHNNMDLARVAAHLHLTIPMVEALERDDYRVLPDAVFVRGYMRSYARLFEADADPIVEAYNRTTHTEPGEPTPAAPERTAVGRRREFSLGATLAGLLVAGALGAVTWWWYQSEYGAGDGQTVTDTLADTAAGTQPGEVSAEVRHPGATIPDPERTVALSEVSAFDPDRMEMEADTEQKTADGMSAGVDLDAASAVWEGAALEVAAVPDEDASAPLWPPTATRAAGGEDVEGTTASSMDNEPVRSPPRPARVTDESTIVLAFVADTWVEIRDADRVPKLKGIMKANTEQAVTGRTPFSLILGNSQGVRVIFDGEPVDHTPYTRGNVARFQLGGAQPETVVQ